MNALNMLGLILLLGVIAFMILGREKAMNALKVLGVILVLGIIAYMIAYPSYSWHQKLTIEVETPMGLASGSSVAAVKWSSGPKLLPAIQRFNNKMQGEAVVVALPDGKYIFALLSKSNNHEYTSDLATKTLYDTTKRTRSKEAFRRVIKLKEPLTVPSNLYPLFVTFTDVNDPTTVQQVDPDDLAASFGEGYSLKGITLEITDEPVTWGKVEKVLGWIYTAESLTPRELRPRFAKDRTFAQKVHLYDFIDIKTWGKKRSERKNR